MLRTLARSSSRRSAGSALAAATCLAWFLVAMQTLSGTASAAPPVDFARDVLPLISDACFRCHGPDEKAREGDLRLDSKEGLYRILDGKAVVKPGKPEESELVRRLLSTDPDEVMPPPAAARHLKPEEIAKLKQWVAEGAPWGKHWAYEAMQRPAPPAVKQAEWVRRPLDRFVLARLEAEGLKPSPEADRERLLRRVTLDLTGLPPTPQEMDAFLADASPEAYEKVVDRLLASPRSAEHLAAEWLDVARFADTHGYQADRYQAVWPYRDWVIKSFQRNQPYDEFVLWQLAGDLLPNATQEQRLATAFNRLHCQNEEGGIVEEEYRVAYVVDRVNTFGTAFLGATFECTRCHDHKYDPFTQKDFYSLFSFFQNVDESGQTSHFTHATPVPTLLLSTPEQDRKLAELQGKVDSVAKEFPAIRDAAKADFEAWLAKPEFGAGSVPGLVARYEFESLEKGRTPNLVQADKPGKIVEDPVLIDGRPAGPGGKQGKAAALDGENGFTFPGAGHVHRSGGFSLAIWVKSPVKHAVRAVVVHHSKAPIDAGSRGCELLLEEGRVAFGLHHMWPGNSLKVCTKGAVAPGAWSHVCATYDGSGKAAGVRIYVDGHPAETEVVRDGLTKDVSYGGGEPEWAIGHRFRDSGFKGGAVDDFRIYDRPLAPLEAAGLAGRDDLNVEKAFVDAPRHREALIEFYLAAVHPPALEHAKRLQAAREAQAKAIEPIPEIMVMQEMPQPKPAYILLRGAYDAHGAAVTADTPKCLPPMPAEAPRNRLGLARWLLDGEHPLTARVTANRYWQLLFGRGLVETAENFGSTGAQPTHPELLDFLARDLVAKKWDLRAFLKEITTSSTYRQSSKVSPEMLSRDPHGILLAQAPARRLSAEMLRDQALFASGLMVEKIGGPSVKPYQPAGLWEEIAMGRPHYDQGKGDDLHRRSLYTFWKRTVPPPAMAAFDAADRSVCSVRRQSTATPLQALAMLNDVQIVEAARHAAQRMFQEGGDSDASRLSFLFRLIASRRPSQRELAVLQSMYAEQKTLFTADPDAAKKLLSFGEAKNDPALPAAELAAAASVAQAIFNHDEALMRR